MSVEYNKVFKGGVKIMVRKLKPKRKVKLKEYEELTEQEIQWFNEMEEIENDFEYEFGEKKQFNIIIPTKEDLDLNLDNAGTNKIENLDERLEIRINKLEKNIIKKLRNEGINVSDLIRNFILNLEEEYVNKNIKKIYDEERIKIEKLILELKSFLAAHRKTFISSKKCETEEDLQEVINERYFYKYKIKDIKNKIFQKEKFIEKYKSFL